MQSFFETWQRKVLRKIYGPIKHQNGWRIRTNDELQFMYRKPNIGTAIEVRRLQWDGHLVRMSDGKTVKKVFLGKPHGRRKAERPKLRWSDCIEKDLKSLCQGMEEESRTHIRMAYRCGGGTG
jgi:hypothetical protein